MIVLTTKAEQKLEYLQGLKRPLTNRESDELQRSMHAVYERDRRLELAAKIEAEWADAILNEHAEHERETLRKVLEEHETANKEALTGVDDE